MSESVDIFRQALKEEGLDAEVTAEEDALTSNTTFYVRKEIAGEMLQYAVRITPTEREHSDNIEKLIAMKASQVYDEFRQQLVNRFMFDNRAIEVSPYDEPYAECLYCDNRVELKKGLQSTPIFANSAEMSTPQPVPKTWEQRLQSLDDNSRVLLKMYLIGKLRLRCEPDCPHSHYDRKI